MPRVTPLSCFGLVLWTIFVLPSMVWGQAQIAPPPAAAITGVYDGTYRCARGPGNLKLTLVAPGDGSLTGVFTFDLPANSRTRTASYTLSGTYDAATGRIRLVPVKWEPPAPPGFVMVGMDGAFNSSAEQVSGKITYPTCTTFEATRNRVQSAALANRPAVAPAAPAARSAPANATQMSASAAARSAPAAPVAEGTAQTTSAPQGQDYAQTNIPPKVPQTSALKKKACDFITQFDAESILGQPVEMNVNNPYVCSFVETGWAKKASTDIKQVHFNVRFEASPEDYAVARKNISDHQAATEVVKELPNFSDAAIWRWIPPAWGQLSAFKGGTIEVVVSIRGIPEDAALQNAKALAAKPLGGTSGTGYVYQRTVQSKPAVASAEPPCTAKEGLVCKSKEYWFHNLMLTDAIKQAFDGEFGKNVDSLTQFRVLFTSYVEMFSKNCRASLPARHEAVTVNQIIQQRDRYGNVVSQQGQSWTVDVDSRFAPKYREYAESLGSSRQGLALALGAMSGRVDPNAYFDLGRDMIQFFNTETCQSAAMHQLGENLLRGAQGKPSLQAAGREPEEKAEFMARKTERENSFRRSIADYDPEWVGQELIVKGTVSRVELKPAPPGLASAKPFQWVTLYFRESPDGAFVVCFGDTHGYTDVSRIGGAEFSGLIGKTIEATGRVLHAVDAPVPPRSSPKWRVWGAMTMPCARNSTGLADPYKIQVF